MPTYQRLIRSAALAAMGTGLAVAALPAGAASATFGPAGTAIQTYAVPAGTTLLKVVVNGGERQCLAFGYL